MQAGMAIALFCDDTTKFNHVLDLYRTYPGAGLPNTLSTGEMGETGRDAGHGYGGLLAKSSSPNAPGNKASTSIPKGTIALGRWRILRPQHLSQ